MSKSALPNLFTFANLSCGVFSIIMLFQEKFEMACLFIIIAGIIDRYDGKIARLLNVSSELGKELDSLADLVSFGVAPALVVFIYQDFTTLNIFGYLLVVLFPIAGAFRLARYNTSQFDGEYTGVPITIAGCFLALYSLILMYSTSSHTELLGVTVILMLILSYLMVSKIKLPKL